jgi:hypothetical protein
MLDAPVSGGVSGARNATLAVMVGGDEAVYNRIKPALDGIGDKVTYIGAIGAGAVASFVHNQIAICTMQGSRRGVHDGCQGGRAAAGPAHRGPEWRNAIQALVFRGGRREEKSPSRWGTGPSQSQRIWQSREDDPITPVTDMEDIAAALPPDLVRLDRFAISGHGVYRDRPQAFLHPLPDFIGV